jgi:CheY-like chemotaxis protein
LELVFPETTPCARFDPQELENALLNLSVNARDAMPAGGTLRIEIAVVHVDNAYSSAHGGIPQGHHVSINVSDSGIGMDENTLQQAFDPFFTTKEVGKGTGLGLSMVYGFVQQSKGHIGLTSELGKGTTVRIYLPLDEQLGRINNSIERKMLGKVGSGRILVVEDDNLVREQAVSQLLSLGYDVETASDGPEAIEKLSASTHFDLLFTDMVMPNGISGKQLADRAKALRPDLPVLFTSGYPNNAISSAEIPFDGKHFLKKPYRIKDLAEKIRAALEKAVE